MVALRFMGVYFLLVLSVSADVIYVDIDNLATPGNGSSWQSAMASIQEGINGASYGDEIWVAEGTYAETITMKSGVSVFGSFMGGETAAEARKYSAILPQAHNTTKRVTIYS